MWLDKLRKMKESSKLTTKEISIQSGIPEPTLEKLFAGVTKDPKLETIRQLVHFFGYTLDDLEDRPTKESPDTAEAVSEEDVTEIFNYLQRSLVSAGLLNEGQDLTDRQADVLVAVCQIIRATFNG